MGEGKEREGGLVAWDVIHVMMCKEEEVKANLIENRCFFELNLR